MPATERLEREPQSERVSELPALLCCSAAAAAAAGTSTKAAGEMSAWRDDDHRFMSEDGDDSVLPLRVISL